ncbi:hypothetical protein [Halomontanus rarus]|uniref:hypothetical protein n=1 Tax=Halomontanus rarus TaxID=3034020 RepID=UPI0023E7FCE3|nr:hypothetical protein [Halovivax sp. TS33]
MTTRKVHVLSTLPTMLLALVLGYHPIFFVALVAGVLLPEIDTVDRRFHRSWLFHTFLAPAIVYQLALVAGVRSEAVYTGIHFVTLGMVLHFVFDYVAPKTQTHPGAEWPVRPSIWSAPWGLMWFGLSWFAQWFLYLSVAFIPWLVGVPVEYT